MSAYGIAAIGTYLPEQRIDNFDSRERFAVGREFIETKIGIRRKALKGKQEATSDLAVHAVEHLLKKHHFDLAEVDILVVVTQNPDRAIPHVSAIVHEKLDLLDHVICYDLSHGCAGFVYGFASLSSMMDTLHLRKGLLITADPYSMVVDPNDKNTSMLFGDGASATLVDTSGAYRAQCYDFGILPKSHQHLTVVSGTLHMDGRELFNFAAKSVPKSVSNILNKANKNIDSVDLFIFHQGSKFLVDTLARQLRLPKDRVPFEATDYGNTVSSSIPLILAEEVDLKRFNSILLCGFGVGLSWGTMLLTQSCEE